MTTHDAFARDLAEVINRHSVENVSDTPDVVLGAFLVGCLDVFDTAVNERARLATRSNEQPQDGYAVRVLDMLETDPDRFHEAEEEDLRAVLHNLFHRTAEAANLESALNSAYRERAHLVALIAAEYPSVWAADPAAGPDWHVVFVDLPTGQASWHISPADWDLFGFVPQGDIEIWDGHTTVEKYKRIFDLTMNVHLRKMTGERPQDDAAQDERAACGAQLPADSATRLDASPDTRCARPDGHTAHDDGNGVLWIDRERAAQSEQDDDVRAVAAFLASDKLGPAMAALHDHFADRIAVLDAGDAKGRDA